MSYLYTIVYYLCRTSELIYYRLLPVFNEQTSPFSYSVQWQSDFKPTSFNRPPTVSCHWIDSRWEELAGYPLSLVITFFPGTGGISQVSHYLKRWFFMLLYHLVLLMLWGCVYLFAFQPIYTVGVMNDPWAKPARLVGLMWNIPNIEKWWRS